VLIILFALLLSAGVLTYLVPAGEYLRDLDGTIIPDSFSYLSGVGGYPVWRWLTAPFEVLGSTDGITIIMISLFLLILGGTFTVMDKTGGITVIIKRLVTRFKAKKYTLLRLVVLVFMSFGAFFGIFEESIALLPIMILLSLSLGWDTLVGVGMTLLAAGFGFASAITNPFSVGIASEIAGVNILSGALYRVFIFLIMYGLLSTFLVRYAKKIEKDPSKSPMYEEDFKKNKNFDMMNEIHYDNEKTIFKTYTTMFVVLLVFVIGISLLELLGIVEIPAIPVIALTFLIGGIVSGIIVTKQPKQTLKIFGNGVLGVAPAILLIMLAASVKFIITQGQIMDTILYYLAGVLTNQSAIVGILLIYALVLIVQFFIGSASAKAILIIPLLIPLVSLVGISKELAILAFVFGDGYTNVIFPTNAVLLIGLSIASVSYTKWFKWTAVLQLITLVLTVGLLLLALAIGY
jgi:uncharacterized ion transporter superfamily protein YfcC